MNLLHLSHIKRTYNANSTHPVHALKDISFDVNAGEYIAIMGESGAGKSTLLNIIATLEKASAGEILLNGQDLSDLTADEAAKYRREHLGFIFQHFNLLDSLSNRDNIYLPLVEDVASLQTESYDKISRQIIYYGAPGTGKSHKIKEILGEYEGCPADKKVPKANIFRTTFHPDSDYSTFVGAYKPTMEKPIDKIYAKGELISKLTEMKEGGVTYSPQKFGAKYWRSLKQLNLSDINSHLVM